VAKPRNRYGGFGLLEEIDDLLIGKSLSLHIRNSSEFAD
jgi:hypothetical protein